MSKDMAFCHSLEIYLKLWKLWLNTRLDALETASKKVIHKLAQAAGEFIGNKVLDKIVKPKNIDQTIIPSEKRRINIEWIITSIMKMEYYKISKLSDESPVSMFVTRKWNEVNDLSGSQYSVNKNIRFVTPILRSDLCDYCDAYIVVKGETTVEGNNANNRKTKTLTFKNNGYVYQKSMTH